MLAVFDGHGKNGAKVSQYVMNQLKELFKMRDFDFTQPRVISQVVDTCHDSLIKNVNCHLSGTTACVCLISDDKLVCSNIGDSRAVLFSKEHTNSCLYSSTIPNNQNSGKWEATQLSSDHKLDRRDEHDRIERSGGTVKQFLNSEGNPFGPLRVWKTEENSPGLAMSRSIGDTLAHTIGVISTPGKHNLM